MYHQSHSRHFLGLAPFHSKDGFSCPNPQRAWPCTSCMTSCTTSSSATKLCCLDQLQNCSFQLITGQLISTPLEAFRLEAGVQSYHKCSNRLIVKAREKGFCSTDNHDKHVALAADIPQHLQNRSRFHRKDKELSILLPPKLWHRQNIIHFPSPPWQLSTPRVLASLYLMTLCVIFPIHLNFPITPRCFLKATIHRKNQWIACYLRKFFCFVFKKMLLRYCTCMSYLINFCFITVCLYFSWFFI